VVGAAAFFPLHLLEHHVVWLKSPLTGAEQF